MYRCCDALQQAMSRIYRQAEIKGGSSQLRAAGYQRPPVCWRRRGKVEDVQQVLGHVDLDHSWPYLDVGSSAIIRRAFELAL